MLKQLKGEKRNKKLSRSRRAKEETFVTRIKVPPILAMSMRLQQHMLLLLLLLQSLPLLLYRKLEASTPTGTVGAPESKVYYHCCPKLISKSAMPSRLQESLLLLVLESHRLGWYPGAPSDCQSYWCDPRQGQKQNKMTSLFPPVFQSPHRSSQ